MSESSAASMPTAIRSWCRATTTTASWKRHTRAAGFTPTSCRRADGHLIAGGNGAAGDDLGIDPAIGVAEAAHQGVRDIEVAHGAFRIDVDGGAPDDSLHDLQPGFADGKRLTEQIELVPGRPAREIHVGSKPQRVHRLADEIFDGGDAMEIDDGDNFFRDIRKAVIDAGNDLRRPLEFGCEIRCEKRFNRGTVLCPFQISLRGDPAVLPNGE